MSVDLHAGMIRWCQDQLAPLAPGFEFRHHDVFELAFNPGTDKPDWASLPVENEAFGHVFAWSVFTHLLEERVEPYLCEIMRLLDADGVFVSTWFLFDKRDYPMLQDFQNALYVNHVNPTNAVIFDAAWMQAVTAAAGLTITDVRSPTIRGYQWTLEMRPSAPGRVPVDLGVDEGIRGPTWTAPTVTEDPSRIGLA